MAANRVNNLLIRVEYWSRVRDQETVKGYLLCVCAAHFENILLNAEVWDEDVLSEPGRLNELSALRDMVGLTKFVLTFVVLDVRVEIERDFITRLEELLKQVKQGDTSVVADVKSWSVWSSRTQIRTNARGELMKENIVINQEKLYAKIRANGPEAR